MLHTIIADVLASPPETLTPTPFNGGVLTQLPKIGTGPGSTPQAFYTSAESPTQSGKLKNTISVIDGGDDPSPGGAALNGFVGFPLVYGWVIDTPTGIDAIKLLDERLHARFRRGVSYPHPNGSGIQFVILERQPIRDGDDFGYAGRVFTIWRIQGTFVRPAV
jgi:hypothetical protein